MDKYILDTNIFIDSKNNAYPFDIVPLFWEKLLLCAQNRQFFLVQEVIDEINAGNDDLAQWMSNNSSSFHVLPITNDVFAAATRISNFISANTVYLESAKQIFLGCADYMLIAYAMAESAVVVTNERENAASRKRVLIPDVCNHFGIQCINRNDFLRAINFSLG